MRPRVLVSVFLLASGVGGSSVTVDLTKYLDADLTYLVAGVRGAPSDFFAGINPPPNVVINPLKCKPHMRVGGLTWNELWNRNRDIYRDWWWIRRQEHMVRQLAPDVTCSMTTLMRSAHIFIVHFLRAQSYLEKYGYESTWTERAIQRLDLKERHMLALERENMKSTNHALIMVSSLATKKALQEHYDVPDTSIVLIRNSVDLNQFVKPDDRKCAEARRSIGIPSQQAVILFVGRSPERKGIDVLISAAARMPRSKIKLVLVGFDRNKYVERLVRDAGVDALVPGDVSLDRLISTYYPAADLFVLPSRVEPYGGAILEAMACGIPPVVSSHCGAAEVIQHGQTGFILDERDSVDELAHIFNRLIHERSDMRKVGDAARRAMEESLSWEEQCRTFAESIERVRGWTG